MTKMKMMWRATVVTALTALAAGGTAFVPATAEAHCGHGCGETDVYVGTQECGYPIYDHYLTDMLYESYNQQQGKWNFTGCDNSIYGCYEYTWLDCPGAPGPCLEC